MRPSSRSIVLIVLIIPAVTIAAILEALTGSISLSGYFHHCFIT